MTKDVVIMYLNNTLFKLKSKRETRLEMGLSHNDVAKINGILWTKLPIYFEIIKESGDLDNLKISAKKVIKFKEKLGLPVKIVCKLFKISKRTYYNYYKIYDEM